MKFYDLKGFNGDYVINKKGDIKNKYGLLMKTFLDNGYVKITLRKNGTKSNLYIHRLLAIQFIPNPKGFKEIDHINRNRGDNRIQNLRWISRRGNNLNRDI